MTPKNLLILIVIIAALFAASKYFNPVHSTEAFIDLAQVCQNKPEASEAPRDPEAVKMDASLPGGNAVSAIPTTVPDERPPTELPIHRMTVKKGDAINVQIEQRDLPLYTCYIKNALLKRDQEAKTLIRLKAESTGKDYVYFYCHNGIGGKREEYPQCLVIVDIQP